MNSSHHKRLDSLRDRFKPEVSEKESRVTARDVLVGIDSIIKRLQWSIAHPEEDDVERYGETLLSHMKRVRAVEKEYDKRHEQWKREHRPDLLNRPPTITDEHLAEVYAEIDEDIAELEAIENQGGGG